LNEPHRLQFFLTYPHACSYLPGREAVTLLADPRAELSPALYTRLAQLGFRRSGNDLYRPHCPACDACIPVRIPVEGFRPRRRDRRCWQNNRDLTANICPAEFRNEHFSLYERYLNSRHPGGGMDQPTVEQYLGFLISRWCETWFVEFRRQGRLLAVAVTDVLQDGLSAVYTFFDPEESRRSLGTYSILWQLEAARRERLRWLYLGYWIEECAKMRYKGDFRPLQAYRDARWIDRPEHAAADDDW
jgi:arginine-tRNA-protein transferase